MSQSIIEFLKERLPAKNNLEIENALKQADRVYTRNNGAVGVSEISKGFWRVVFFAADSKKTRNALIDEVVKDTGLQVFVYERVKHNNKVYYHAAPFLRRLKAI